MTVKTGGAWAGTFVTQDATGALATPSVGPAGVLYVDGVANAAEVTITGSNPYKFSVTLPALTAGQRVDMYITATIATIATAGFVASEQADTFIVSDIETLVDGLETMLTDIHDTDLPAIKTETAAILADTGTDGVALSAAGVDAILDEVVVGTYTMRQLLALFAAKLHGTAAGGNTDTITYDSLDGTTTSVIVETVDEDGNRTVVLTV